MAIYIPSIGPHDARIAVIGEAPGEEEERNLTPFSARKYPMNAGYLLDRILVQAGLRRAEIFIGNVCRYRPPGNRIEEWLKNGPHHINGKHVHDNVMSGIEELGRELTILNPHVIITLGNVPMWALTGEWGITARRGSQYADPAGRKVVATLHPAAVLRYRSPRLIAECAGIVAQDFRRAVAWADAEGAAPFRVPLKTRHVRPSYKDVMVFLDRIWHRLGAGESPRIVIDLETLLYHIDCIGIAVSATESICITFLDEDARPFFTEAEETQVLWALRRVLTHPNARVGGHALAYDCQHMARWWGFIPRVTDDSMAAQHVCFPGGDSDDPLGKRKRKPIIIIRKGLDFCASMYCSFYRYWKADVRHSDDLPATPKAWEDRWRYNCDDVLYSYEIAERLDENLERFGLRAQYEFLMRRWHAVFRMTIRGWRVDEREKTAASARITVAQQECRDWFNTAVTPDMRPRVKTKTPWYDSASQRATLLYDILRAPEQKGKTGGRTADEGALKTLSKRGGLVGDVAMTLLRYQELGGLRNNFIDAVVDADGRIRSGFDVAGPESFRLASRLTAFGIGTNLQNLKTPPKLED